MKSEKLDRSRDGILHVLIVDYPRFFSASKLFPEKITPGKERNFKCQAGMTYELSRFSLKFSKTNSPHA